MATVTKDSADALEFSARDDASSVAAKQKSVSLGRALALPPKIRLEFRALPKELFLHRGKRGRGAIQLGELLADGSWMRWSVDGFVYWEVCFDLAVLTPAQQRQLESLKYQRETRVAFCESRGTPIVDGPILGFDDKTHSGLTIFYFGAASATSL